jgi:uncharacterized protein YbjT (DUF2867 family)
MILVTGATGHVGSEVVAQLAASPDTAGPIRAMTRRPQATGFPPRVEVVYGTPATRPASVPRSTVSTRRF